MIGMEQAIYPTSSNVPRELGAFAQENVRLWHEHIRLIRADSKHRKCGVVYTPETLVSTLTSLVFAELPPHNSITVLDPSCGTGNFLVAAYQRLAGPQTFFCRSSDGLAQELDLWL